MADILAGRPVIAPAKGISYIGDAVDVVEELTDGGAPGGGARQDVIGGQFEALGEAVLQLNREAVIDGVVVGTEQRDRGRGDGNNEPGRVFVTAVLVHPLLMLVGNIKAPVVTEGAFVSGAGGERVGSVIVRIDQGARAGSVL